MPGDHKETTKRELLASNPDSSSRRKLISLGLGIVLFILIYFFLPVTGTESHSATDIRTGLAILALAATLWLTEALPLAVTALLIPIAATLSGVFSSSGKMAVTEAFKNFAHPFIFLFLGGFAIAAALSRQGIDRWIAHGILSRTQGSFFWSGVALFGVAAGLSMWISNTATTALLLPVALGMLTDLRENSGKDIANRAAPFLLLGLAYSASLGGLGTIIGTAPNAFTATQLDISFVDWLYIGIPCVLVLLPLMILLLTIITRPRNIPPVPVQKLQFSFTRDRIATLVIFLLAVACWIFSKPLSSIFGDIKYFDSIIAVGALVLLCAFHLVSWKDIDKTTDWGVLILFGGGITLSSVLGKTGASAYLAELLRLLTAGWPLFLIVGAVVFFVIFLTELSSNTATTTLFVPIFLQVGISLGIDPAKLVLPLTIAASCAFMLPIATPPNAIVFGAGLVPQRTMMRIGLRLNLVFVLVLTALSSILF
ncbi:MAG: DASS family sodium-coupled anion symporter [Akkermansiaceae bacterium]|nr:DASS family sodium-coupled anion symporter [Akkermansiaceae bacterium]